MLNDFYLYVMRKTGNKNKLIDPCGHTIGIDSSDENEQNNHNKQIKHQGGIDPVFDRDRPLMVLRVEIVLMCIFFNTYSGTDKKEDHERFCETIDDGGKDHKRHMIRC